VRISQNEEVLGWDRNIRRLLSRVATPFFVVLPHDDLLAPSYVEALLGELARHPDAVVAYADMFIFGAQVSRKWLDVSVPLHDRILDFFLGGAEAVPWRGVTRTSVLDGAEFPVDGEGGFLVECEWALHLISRGPAVRVPRPLYGKRVFGPETATASRARLTGKTREGLIKSLEHHRKRMLAAVSALDLPADARPLVECAVEAAMLRRHVGFSLGPLTPDQRARARALLAESSPAGTRVQQMRSMVLDVLARDAATAGDATAALKIAFETVDAWPSNVEGLLHLAGQLLAADRRFEAVECAVRAATLAPNVDGVADVLHACGAALDGGIVGTRA
jgi:hypothetical protein